MFGVTNAVAAALGDNIETAFGQIGLASTAARERLIALAGGIEPLAAGTAFFSQNFLSEEERMAPVIKQVDEVLGRFGWAGIRTKEQLAQFVKSLDLSSEAGAKAYAAVMSVQGAFLEVANAAETAKQKAREEATARVDAAFGGLQRSVDAQKDIVTAAYESTMKGLNLSLDEVNGRVGKLSSLSSTLKSTIDGMRIAGMEEFERSAAKAQIQSAIAIARAGGPLPSSESLSRALQIASQPNEQMFASFVDFQREQLVTKNTIQELSGLTDEQLSVEEQTLKAIEGQIKTAEDSYKQEISRLDDIVKSAQAQIDALNGINTSVLSVRDAIAGFNKASVSAGGGALGGIAGTRTGATLSGDPTADFLDSIYNQYLKRDPDQDGFEYYSNLLNSGQASVNDVIHSFINSEEFKRINGFAAGGDHLGGWRIVGERGPELEATGPSRIFNASQTAQILRGGSDQTALVAEVKALKEELVKLRAATDEGNAELRRTANAVNGNPEAPMLVEEA